MTTPILKMKISTMSRVGELVITTASGGWPQCKPAIDPTGVGYFLATPSPVLTEPWIYKINLGAFTIASSMLYTQDGVWRYLRAKDVVLSTDGTKLFALIEEYDSTFALPNRRRILRIDTATMTYESATSFTIVYGSNVRSIAYCGGYLYAVSENGLPGTTPVYRIDPSTWATLGYSYSVAWRTGSGAATTCAVDETGSLLYFGGMGGTNTGPPEVFAQKINLSGVVTSGTAEAGSSTTKLVDTTKNFTALGVTTGCVVVKTSTYQYWRDVTSISTTTNPNDTLNFSTALSGFSAGDAYHITPPVEIAWTGEPYSLYIMGGVTLNKPAGILYVDGGANTGVYRFTVSPFTLDGIYYSGSSVGGTFISGGVSDPTTDQLMRSMKWFNLDAFQGCWID